MLKHRVITAGILIPIVLATIFFAPSYLIKGVLAIVMMLAAIEWRSLIKLDLTCLAIFVGLVCALVGIYKAAEIPVVVFLFLSAIWWLLGFVAVYFYPRRIKIWQSGIVKIFAGVSMFMPVLVAIDWLLTVENFRIWLLFLLLLVWTADIAAYFSGKIWGKHKLSIVSPGKTWEGFFGALFSNICLTIAFFLILDFGYGIFVLIPFSLFVTICSVVGDLVESFFKRIAGVKDSGNLLPGHGGVLDRVDSLVAAIPMFALGLQFVRSLDAI